MQVHFKQGRKSQESHLNCFVKIAPGPSGPECQCPHSGKWYLANNGKDCIQDTGKRCQPEQFTCLNGNCISIRWACDGYKDCADNSDELERVCGEALGLNPTGRLTPCHLRRLMATLLFLLPSLSHLLGGGLHL